MADRAVLTTGANSGIGLATVVELARRGFRSIGSVRTDEKAEQVQKAAADAGVAVETVLLDVNDAEACERLVPGLGLHGLVNNAGYSLYGAIEDVTDGEARDLLETMVVAPMRLARLALPHMRTQHSGCIVNISSIAGRTTSPLTGWYHAAKHALEAASDALRMEVARDGVKVVLVEPGGFRTNIWEEFERDVERRRGSRYQPSYERALRTVRLTERFMGDPEHVAKVIAGAVASKSPRSRYLVGIDAQAAAFADFFTPTMVKDRVTRLVMGL